VEKGQVGIDMVEVQLDEVIKEIGVRESVE